MCSPRVQLTHLFLFHRGVCSNGTSSVSYLYRVSFAENVRLRRDSGADGEASSATSGRASLSTKLELSKELTDISPWILQTHTHKTRSFSSRRLKNPNSYHNQFRVCFGRSCIHKWPKDRIFCTARDNISVDCWCLTAPSSFVSHPSNSHWAPPTFDCHVWEPVSMRNMRERLLNIYTFPK